MGSAPSSPPCRRDARGTALGTGVGTYFVLTRICTCIHTPSTVCRASSASRKRLLVTLLLLQRLPRLVPPSTYSIDTPFRLRRYIVRPQRVTRGKMRHRVKSIPSTCNYVILHQPRRPIGLALRYSCHYLVHMQCTYISTYLQLVLYMYLRDLGVAPAPKRTPP